jgi:hypothetical protein
MGAAIGGAASATTIAASPTTVWSTAIAPGTAEGSAPSLLSAGLLSSVVAADLASCGDATVGTAVALASTTATKSALRRAVSWGSTGAGAAGGTGSPVLAAWPLFAGAAFGASTRTAVGAAALSSNASNVPEASLAAAAARPEFASGHCGCWTTGADATWGKTSPHQAHGSAQVIASAGPWGIAASSSTNSMS